MRYIIDPNAKASACCLVNCRSYRQLGTKNWHYHAATRPLLYDEKLQPRLDPSAPPVPAFCKDKIVCDQCWYKSALGEEVSVWLQVTFTEKHAILDNSGWQAKVDVSKPLAPQMQEAAKLIQAEMQEGETARDKKRKILGQVKDDWLKYGKKPSWLNDVDATRPLAPQLKACPQQGILRAQTATGSGRHRRRGAL